MADFPADKRRRARAQTGVDATVEAKLISGFEMLPVGSFAMLVHINGSQSRSIPTDPDGITIGRQETDICIDDDRLSPEHARIFCRDGAWYVEDLASLHGTFVDSVRVVSCLLCNGDHLQCGEQSFRFVMVAKPGR